MYHNRKYTITGIIRFRFLWYFFVNRSFRSGEKLVRSTAFIKFYFYRPGILNDHTEYIRKKIPNCHFPSNPCRIQFGSRQIVVFREDLLQKMSRNAIKIPDSEKLSEDLAKTLVCQAHLSPLPLHVVPIYWNYDHVMRLYPLPDLVVVADKQRAYTHTHSDCTVISPVIILKIKKLFLFLFYFK